MGDGHDRAGVVAQEAFEPRHGLGVEVVGGLVEQQQVGAREQQPAQRHPATLAARQRGDVGVAGRQAQGVHGDLGGALQVPGAGGLDLRLEVGLAGAELLVVGLGVGPAGHDLVVVGQQRRDLADSVHHVAVDVLPLVELGLLLEHADGEAGGEARLAGVPVVDARHDAQQRRLSGAVRAEHADLGARVEGQADVLQHLLVGRVEPAELAHGVDELRGHGARRYRAAADGPEPGVPGQPGREMAATTSSRTAGRAQLSAHTDSSTKRTSRRLRRGTPFGAATAPTTAERGTSSIGRPPRRRTPAGDPAARCRAGGR